MWADHPKSIVLRVAPHRDGVAFTSPTEGAFTLTGWQAAKNEEEALEWARKHIPEGTEITVEQATDQLPSPKLGGMQEEERGYGTDGTYEAEGVSIRFGGACPVQGEGEVDGFGIYYRSRGNGWTLEIKNGGDEPWMYGEWEMVWPDAGWLHRDETVKNIEKAVAKFREGTQSS